MPDLALTAVILLVGGSVASAGQKLERFLCRGVYQPACLDSSIGDDCSFISYQPRPDGGCGTKSTDVHRKISCEIGHECEVEALVRTTNGSRWIEKVLSVKDHGPAPDGK